MTADMQPTDMSATAKPMRDAAAAAGRGCLVVGMGASAGGIEAFGKFFDAMPNDSGAAFVLVLHLDPNRESQMAKVLSVHTKMPVVQVEDQMKIEPNHVYVIAPDFDLTVVGGVLHLTKPAEKRGHRHPVDVLFRSLAFDQGERVIAVVLSGTGSNGTDGLKEVRAAGGLVLVQDPASAKFDGMPRSAIAAGMADHILPPEAMPAILGKYFRNEYIAEPSNGETSETGSQHLIDQVLAVVRTRTGHNFNTYRRSTLQRRIQRRLGLGNIASLEDYLTILRNDPNEAALLVKDLLINVTSFFRDAEAWQTLCSMVIAPMVAARDTGSTIRAWVPGCSTGEEAYTLAMLIAEQATLVGKTFDVKIFATDAREDNLQIAREGAYPVAAVTGLDAIRKRRFFDPSEATYKIKKDLRATVIFAPQNLLSDPPFSHLDVVTCRNLLIYLEPDAQQGIIALFHFALEKGGAMMLGNTETVGRHSEAFETLSKKWRIYQRQSSARLDIMNFPVLRGQPTRLKSDQPTATPALFEPSAPAADLARRALLQRFAPAAILIDAAGSVVYYHGSTAAYLEQPTGEPSNDIYTIAREGLVTKLRAAVRKAREDGADVTFEAKLRHIRGNRPVVVTVSPIAGTGRGHVLISFVTSADSLALAAIVPPINQSHDADLRDELAAVRSELQNTIEHLETANEELKAANEEATSMNEELQSTNEELETSKEEMQSFNEELHTVNGQLQSNVRDLEDSTNDLNNLLAGTDTATLFLDEKFCIKWFTPGLRDLLDLLPGDIGRPLEHFALKFRDENLLADAARVMEKLQVLETEVSGTDGRWYLRRMLPYRTLDNRIAGVVITFFDVTGARMARHASTEARLYAQAIVDTVVQPLLVLDDALTVVSLNPAFATLFRVSESAEVGKPVSALASGGWSGSSFGELLKYLVLNGVPFNDTAINQSFAHMGMRNLLVHGRRLLREGLPQSQVLLTIEDVTDRRRAEIVSRHLAAIVTSSRDAIISIDADGLIDTWNRGAATIFGYAAADIIGKPMSVMNDPAQLADVPDCLTLFRKGKDTVHYETSRIRANGSAVWVSVTESPLRNTAGVLLGASSISRDITDRRIAEHHREILMSELNHRVKNSLAVVQALASQTLRGEISLPDARQAFGERLRVMARAHDLLVTANWTSTDLASVIEATVEPHRIGPTRISIEGPFVPLKPQLAVTFSLAVHELCTNAAKYGALSVPEGRVDIKWTISGPAQDSRLWWQWVESGGPVVTAPVRKGFGSSLIEQVLPMELLGEVTVAYKSTGVVCTLQSPAPDLIP